MNRTALIKRIEALESRKPECKPVDLSRFFAELAVLFIAKRRKKYESMLAAYARACRYRGGVADLWEAVSDDHAKFHRKHCKVTARPSPHTCMGRPLPDIVPSHKEIEDVRRVILGEFLLEELVWRFFDAWTAAGGKLVGNSPLAEARPMREIVAESCAGAVQKTLSKIADTDH
jgi:hypothetical protein